MRALRIVFVFLCLLCTQGRTAFAQWRFEMPSSENVNDYLDGGRMRALSAEEQSMVRSMNASAVGSAAMGLGTLVCGMGAMIYDHEAKKIADSDWWGFGKVDAQVSKFFLAGTVLCATASVALGISSLCIRKRLNDKTIIMTSIGGIAVEF